MSWNYRVIRREFENGEPQLAIHEVYYDENGAVRSWTLNPVVPAGETFEEFSEDLFFYRGAVGRPVLEEKELEKDIKSLTEEESQETEKRALENLRAAVENKQSALYNKRELERQRYKMMLDEIRCLIPDNLMGSDVVAVTDQREFSKIRRLGAYHHKDYMDIMRFGMEIALEKVRNIIDAGGK